MMNSIKIENFDNDGLCEQITVGKTVYSSPEVTDSNHIQWKHLNSPYGKSIVVALRDEKGILVGRSFLQKRKFWINKSFFCRGAIVNDLVISPHARSASTLIGMTRATRSPAGIDLVVHTSNEVSDPIYRNLFKFPIECSLMAFGLPLHFSKVLKPYLKTSKVLKLIDFILAPWRWGLLGLSIAFERVARVGFMENPLELEVQEVFDGFREISGSHFERSLAFYRWRFDEGPLFNGEIRWVKSHGICIGCVVFNQVQLGGLNACVLMDIVMRKNLTMIEAIAIKLLALKYALITTSDVIFTLVNIGNPTLKWLKGFPFASIPDSLLPHSTPIFIHATEEIFPKLSRKCIYLTLADLDYF